MLKIFKYHYWCGHHAITFELHFMHFIFFGPLSHKRLVALLSQSMLIITFIFPGGRIQCFTILSPSHFWVVFYLGSQVKNLSGILRLHVFRIFYFYGS